MLALGSSKAKTRIHSQPLNLKPSDPNLCSRLSSLTSKWWHLCLPECSRDSASLEAALNSRWTPLIRLTKIYENNPSKCKLRKNIAKDLGQKMSQNSSKPHLETYRHRRTKRSSILNTLPLYGRSTTTLLYHFSTGRNISRRWTLRHCFSRSTTSKGPISSILQP